MVSATSRLAVVWRFAMSSKVQFKSGAFEAIHASAAALHKVGAIDKATMRSFNETCLSVPPEQINQPR